MSDEQGGVIAFSGGIGGAKLALGLSRVVPADNLIIVANPGDDFEHLGLTICPDLDTLIYTLAGIVNPDTGWGRANETWTFMQTLEALGGETWFQLGDGDLALHVERTRRLAAGEPLRSIGRDICRRLGVAVRIFPASDDPVRTVVETADGPLAFQHYFVRDRAAPAVTGFHFDGAEEARGQPAVRVALTQPHLQAIVICPSNPFISIDPILAISEIKEGIEAAAAPVIAVSPIVGGQAIKGPTAKMMTELGLSTTAKAVAEHYGDLLDGFVIDTVDAAAADDIRALGLEVLVTDTVMRSDADKEALARQVVDFAKQFPSPTQ